MITNKFIQVLFLTLCLVLISTNANAKTSENLVAKTTKEIWLEFEGTNDCEVGHCADGIPALILENALIFLKNNPDSILNKDFIAMADMTKNSLLKRLFILNLRDGSVDTTFVAHGINSESSLGMATKFSNRIDSLKTSLGFYLTEEDTFIGKNGESLRLDGLSTTNSNAHERAILIHSAKYVSEDYIKDHGAVGNSEGCLAVPVELIESILLKLKGKALVYVYSNLKSSDAKPSRWWWNK